MKEGYKVHPAFVLVPELYVWMEKIILCQQMQISYATWLNAVV